SCAVWPSAPPTCCSSYAPSSAGERVPVLQRVNAVGVVVLVVNERAARLDVLTARRRVQHRDAGSQRATGRRLRLDARRAPRAAGEGEAGGGAAALVGGGATGAGGFVAGVVGGDGSAAAESPSATAPTSTADDAAGAERAPARAKRTRRPATPTTRSTGHMASSHAS